MAVTRRQVLTDLTVWSGLALAGGGYAFAVEPGLRLVTTTYRLTPAGWPAGRRLKVVIIADPHMGEPYWPVSRLEAVVERANALAPDLTVLLGDYEGSHLFITRHVPMRATAETLAALRAPLGVYAIIGNHDWWVDAEAQAAQAGPTRARRELERAGVPVLENDAVRLGEGDRAFWLLGTGSVVALRRPGRGFGSVADLDGTLAQVTDDAPAILLAHEPVMFQRVPDRIALTLCGHTHGGQVRLFGWSPVTPSGFTRDFAYGHKREGARDLVISGGLGCSYLPVRLGVPPEITVVELGWWPTSPS